MLKTATAMRGMVSASHHLAAETGLAVLREGGNAIEAMVAAAATMAVVYPHMNGIGGDGFWLIHTPGADPVAIDACGAAALDATAEFYEARGHHHGMPVRGPLAACTVAGTVSGWQTALAISAQWGGRMKLASLLQDAIHYASSGMPPTDGQRRLTGENLADLKDVPGFASTFLLDGALPPARRPFKQPRLAETLAALCTEGPEGFYRGKLAKRIAADLVKAGSPVSAADLARHRARAVDPLFIRLDDVTLYNLPPPTQGLASLMILGIFGRLGVRQADGFDHIHGLVEATKQAFLVRDRYVTDPAFSDVDPKGFLSEAVFAERAERIRRDRALPWPPRGGEGDTIWMGAIDSEGRSVSFIQSLYWEFGSGVVLDETGILWQNRGSSFRLELGAQNRLAPGRKPFHTLNPALALFDDGRVMVYGTMGGDGQPQTQAAVFTRYARFGQELQQAVTAPRWLLGRTWGEDTASLKLESRFEPGLAEALRAAGHAVEPVEPFSELMGHAGAVVRHPNGVLEGAADPRGDGRAAGY